jgi:1-acyl-sn-glycerol-3-phosphate acyltransferase
MPRPVDPRNPGASGVYRAAARVAFTVMDLQRWRIETEGLEHVPRRGGAVIAANHASYWDFFLAGRGPYLAWGRPVRILAKEALFEVPLFGGVMRRAEHIPVHRGSGAQALATAIERAHDGELVLVLPEQTIARSFELLPFKSGAARMAIEAQVPLVPAVSWGSHRFHTKGRPMRPRWRLPVVVRYGAPLHPGPGEDPEEVTEQLRRRMATLLAEVQRDYPDGAPAGQWWVPERLGGSAPSHEEVLRQEAERAEAWRREREARAASGEDVER